ncbi:MAG: GNAT family N-acetyltransferase [Sphingobacteriaceae bacterium]|nr:GNAT family N-acetyltransferase [Cytophagaceae bacterium]
MAELNAQRIAYGPAQGDAALEKILTLQAENLRGTLTPEHQSAQGFLTFRYDLPLLQRMNNALPHVVAATDTQLAGYALSTTPEICRENPLLRPLVERLDGLVFGGKPFAERRFYVMGQICVAEGFRGQGVFDGLYQTHQALYDTQFDCLVTEISLQNTRSLAAHRRVGFEVIDEVQDAADRWAVVMWNWA